MRTSPYELWQKLLRLARDPAVQPGEKRNAEAMAARIAEREGFREENVTRGSARYGFTTDKGFREHVRKYGYNSWDWFNCDYCGEAMLRAKRSATAKVPRYADPEAPGRERDYCSNKCRQAAYRKRKRES